MVNSNKSRSVTASKIPAPVFGPGKYLTAEQKKRVYASFVRFVESGFDAKHFSKSLYHHLSQHCGFIAHFNLENFYMVRFHSPEGRAATLAKLSSRGGSKWRFVDENCSGTADLSRAIATLVDATAAQTIEGIRRDELASIDAQLADLMAKRDALTSADMLEDPRVIDVA